MKVNQSINIEFVGLPGTGKTTISALMTELLNNKRINTINTVDSHRHHVISFINYLSKTKHLMYLTVTKPSLVAQIISIVFPNKNFSLLEFIKDILNLCYTISLILILQNSPGFHILDEGLLQYFWSYQCRHCTKIDLNLFLEIWTSTYSFKSNVICLSAKTKTIKERLFDRKNNCNKMGKMVRMAKSSEMFHEMEETRILAELLSKSLIVNLYYIDTDLDIDSVKKKILPDVIQKILS